MRSRRSPRSTTSGRASWSARRPSRAPGPRHGPLDAAQRLARDRRRRGRRRSRSGAANHLAAAVGRGRGCRSLAESGRRPGPVALLVLGAGLIAVRLAVGRPPPPWRAARRARSVDLVVESSGSPRDGQQRPPSATPPAHAGVHGRGDTAALSRTPPGDRVARGPIRPAGVAYGAYLERIGAVGTLRSRSMTVEPAPATPGDGSRTLRRGAAERSPRVLPEPEAGLAAGILIGLRDRVDRDLAAAFTTAGVSHVVAISGWNIAIVAAAVAALAGRLRRRRRSVVTMLAIVAYVAFAGARHRSSAPARWPASCCSRARAARRSRGGGPRLGGDAPARRRSGPHRRRGIPAVVAGDGRTDRLGDAADRVARAARSRPVPALAGGEPRRLARRTGGDAAVVLVAFGRLAVLVARSSTWPSSRSWRRRWPPGWWRWSAAASCWPARRRSSAPSWPCPAGSSSAARSRSSSRRPACRSRASRSTAPGRRCGRRRRPLALAGLVWSRRSGARAVAGPRPPRPCATRGRDARRPRAAPIAGRRSHGAPGGAGSLVGRGVVAGAVVARRPAASPAITVLDVGQGDAILVEGSRGGRLLIDGGPDPDRLLVVLDGRMPPWDRRIDTVILTHPHEDHVAGLALLLARYRVGRVSSRGCSARPRVRRMAATTGRAGAPDPTGSRRR